MHHQLFTCLVLKSFLKTGYRGVVAHLTDCPSLVETLDLISVPLARRNGSRTLGTQTARFSCCDRLDWPGIDAARDYFMRCRDRVGTPWKKASFIITSRNWASSMMSKCISSHSRRAGRSGTEAGCADFQSLVAQTLREWASTVSRPMPGLNPTQQTTASHDMSMAYGPISPETWKACYQAGYRPLPVADADAIRYAGVQVETVISMLKRRLEAWVRGRTHSSECCELRLKVLTHNVVILLCIKVFYGAKLTDLSTVACKFSQNCSHCMRVGVCQSQPGGLLIMSLLVELCGRSAPVDELPTRYSESERDLSYADLIKVITATEVSVPFFL